MRRSGFFVILPALFLALGTAGAQQELAPSTDQGPIPIKPVPPTPDKDGVYSLTDGITPPGLRNAVPAVYPADAAEADRPRNIVVSAVVGIDGVPVDLHVVNSLAGEFIEPAIAAVQQSRFQPGTLDGKPVPVRVYVRVPFLHLAPAVPRLALQYGQNGGFGPQRPADPFGIQPGDTPPKPIHFANPEFSDEARRKKIQGIVIVSVLVTEEGEPTDVRVEKSLGYGLDEQAIKAALKYKFKPAMRDGNPVSKRIMIEMNFRLN